MAGGEVNEIRVGAAVGIEITHGRVRSEANAQGPVVSSTAIFGRGA